MDNLTLLGAEKYLLFMLDLSEEPRPPVFYAAIGPQGGALCIGWLPIT